MPNLSDTETGTKEPLLEKVSLDYSPDDIFKLSKGALKQLFDESNANQKQNLKEIGYVEGILRKLSSYSTAGIPGDEGDLKRRMRKFESNIKPLPQIPSVFLSLKQTIMTSKIWWIILGSAILSSLCGGLIYGLPGTYEGISIAIVGVGMIFLSTYFDWQKDMQFVKL